jgi:hypothetical protein
MKVKVEFEIEFDEIEHTEEQLEEYLRFMFGDNGVMSGNNPFNVKGQNVDPIFGSFSWDYVD